MIHQLKKYLKKQLAESNTVYKDSVSSIIVWLPHPGLPSWDFCTFAQYHGLGGTGLSYLV